MAGLFVSIWYHPLSWWVYEYGQYSITTSEKIREVLSDVHLSLDNCYSTSKNWNAVDLNATWISVFWSGDEANIYQVNCAVPLTSHGHIDTLHMKHVQETVTDYSAMRGPCPEWFHIPLASEWSSLISKPWTGSNFATNLKIPLHAKYLSSSWNKWQSWESRYHCADKWQNLICKGSAWLDASWPIWDWLPIRAFKDVPVVPDSSWDVIFDWSSIANNSGIFRNQTMWLVSISSDWINWLTIQDKNLWATNVWDIWYYYQWWNCHWFNWEKQTVTSSTQINASTYWPNNYYSSSTFITADQWDSSNNKNLRWWVTWIVPSEWHREPVYYGPEITLLSYEEILAMAGDDKADDIVAVLNEHPEEYYNKLSSEWHMKLDSYHTWGKNGYVILGTNNYIMYFWMSSSPKDSVGSIFATGCNETHIWYIPSTWLWDYFCDNEPT